VNKKEGKLYRYKEKYKMIIYKEIGRSRKGDGHLDES
jgi:hypothetical protein